MDREHDPLSVELVVFDTGPLITLAAKAAGHQALRLQMLADRSAADQNESR